MKNIFLGILVLLLVALVACADTSGEITASPAQQEQISETTLSDAAEVEAEEPSQTETEKTEAPDSGEEEGSDEYRNISAYEAEELVVEKLIDYEILAEYLVVEYLVVEDLVTEELMAEEPEIVTAGMPSAVVARTIDGDTVELYTGERVRLIGVDTPERGEPGFNEATEFTRNLVEGETVWLSGSGNDTDRFGRLRRYVWIQEPTDPQSDEQIQSLKLNALLLLYGHAVVMEVGGETHAWSRNIIPIQTASDIALTPEPPPEPPSEATPAQPPTPPATPIPESQPEPEPQQEPPIGPTFIGNVNSQIFHRTNGSTLPAPRNQVHFDSRDAAIAAGHRPCQRCRP